MKRHAEQDQSNETYSVVFGEGAQSEHDGDTTVTYAEVCPPFSVTSAARMIDDVKNGGVQVEEYASTQTTTLLRLTVDGSNKQFHTSTHEKRVALSRRTAVSIVNMLNIIDAGNYIKRIGE